MSAPGEINAEDGSSENIHHRAPPPDPLPPGWVVRKSRSHPGCIYCFNQFTGECRWEAPTISKLNEDLAAAVAAVVAQPQNGSIKQEEEPKAASESDPRHGKRSSDHDGSGKRKNNDGGTPSSLRKRSRTSNDTADSSPKEVRVLHLLKKHRGSRRPASWRKSKITISREEAVEELKELIGILEEVAEDSKELKATFEELARTESDCSSAKRGGDLGFFGRKKMQPAFEKVSFSLKVGELSDIVETSSGVHVILRLG